MNWLKNKKYIIVHDGNFHPDDVFSVALLSLLYKNNIKVIRTRDQKVYFKADYVLDTGGEYDSDKNRFDHHQTGGAGKRDNGILYSTFGLLWKKYGETICGSKEVADILDSKLIVSIDADDNGFNLYEEKIQGIRPTALTDIIYLLRPTGREDIKNVDKNFFQAVNLAKMILARWIKVTKDKLEIKKIILDYYEKSNDKRLIIIDRLGISRYEIWEALENFPEPLFIICQDINHWSVIAMRKNANDYGNRKDFPSGWAGLRDEALAEISNVPDALFCHNNLFLAVAKSKIGALALAEKALES